MSVVGTTYPLLDDTKPYAIAHRAEIDGFRAMAVLPVLIIHAGFGWLPGGFLGVDIFFVISGYLIAGILRREITAGNFSLIQFYERRCRRILPALFVVLFATTISATFIMLSDKFKNFGQSLFATTVFSSNMLFARQNGYFESVSEYKPLIHTWSLGVEEQFYILFPILLFILLRQHKIRPISALLVIALSSLAFAEYGLRNFPAANFFLLPSREWELLAGAMLALIHIDRANAYKRQPRIFQALSALGVVAILAAYLGAGQSFPSPGIGASLVVVGAALVLTYATPATWAHSLLTTPLLRGIGLISYSAYLLHQPLFVFARLYLVEISAWQWWILIAVTILLAWLVWRYVENPFRDPKRVSRRMIFTFTGAGMLFFGTVGLSIHLLHGIPQRFTSQAKLIDDGAKEISPLRDECGNTIPASFDDFCVFGRAGTPIVAVLGDSHGKELFWRATTQLGDRPYALQAFLWNACLPFSSIQPGRSDECEAFHRAFHQYILDNDRIKAVVIAADWPGYFDCLENCSTATHNVRRGEHVTTDRIQDMTSAMATEIDQYRAAGKAVMLIYPVPKMPWDVPRYMYSHWLRGFPVQHIGESRSIHDSRTASATAFLDSQVNKPGVSMVDPAELLCTGDDGSFCRAELNGLPLYFDNGHLNGFGADGVAAAVLARLDTMTAFQN